MFKTVHKGHQKKANFALVLERCIDLMLNDGQKRFHIKTFFREFLGALLDARVMHLLEKSENCASFDTLRTMIYEIKTIQKGSHGMLNKLFGGVFYTLEIMKKCKRIVRCIFFAQTCCQRVLTMLPFASFAMGTCHGATFLQMPLHIPKPIPCKTM